MALDKKLQQKLAKAGKAWKTAKNRAATETTGGFDEFEDGRYIARLVSAEIGESKSSGRLQIAWGYKIAEGDYKGRTKFDYEGLETEENLVWLARKLARYGYEAPDDLEGVAALLAEIVKDRPLVRIRLKTKGEFQNAYLDAVYSKEDEDEALSEARAEETDVEEEEAAEAEEEEEAAEAEAEAEAEEEEEAEAEAEEEEEAVELTAGMRVRVGGKDTGTVVEILDPEDKARIKLDSGKVVRAAIESLETVDEEAEEEEEEVPPAPKRAAAKPAPKPAPKKGGKR